MTPPKADFLAILTTLSAHKVDFIIVGGIAAALQGAPIATFDLDLVHSRTSLNLERLLAALRELEAFYRGQRARKIEPTAGQLASPGPHLLLTVHGPLDLHGTIGAGRDYDLLLKSVDDVSVRARRFQVLGLSMLIESKEEAGREKDRAVLPILRRTLEERRKQ